MRLPVSDALRLRDEERRRLSKATPEDRLKMECWCGAEPGRPCVNYQGKPAVTQHVTRGMRKDVVVALARVAGLSWPS